MGLFYCEKKSQAVRLDGEMCPHGCGVGSPIGSWANTTDSYPTRTLAGMKHQSRASLRLVPVAACIALGSVHALAQTQANGTPVAATSSAGAVDLAPAFDIFEIVVEGNTVLSAAAIEKAVTPFLGPGKRLVDVETARTALEKVYQDAGYLTVFVDVPEQSTAEGVIRLNVIEGRVERLAVTGSRYFSQGYIRQRVPELAEGKVPNFNVVQAQLGDVNRTDDRRVQPVLKPGRTPGSVDAELQVTDQVPLHGNLELNNNHAQFTQPWRLQATMRYDNLFQQDHSLTLMAITAPQNPQQSKVLSLEYAVPQMGGDAWRYSLLYSNSNIDALGAATILGKGYTWGVRRQLGLPSTPSLNQNVTLGVDYKDTQEKTIAGADGLSTPMRYLPLNLGYTAFVQSDEGAQTSVNTSMVFGIKQLMQRNHDCGFGNNDQFACKRAGADGGFAYLRLDARRSQPLAGWSVDVRLAAQLASQALLGAEQFALGGADSIRGYLAAEGVGDHGVLTNVEVRTPNLVSAKAADTAGSVWSDVTDLRVYAFGDAGRVRTIDAAAGQTASQTLSSVGLGLKLKSRKYMSLTLDWAVPLQAATVTLARHPHTHLALGLEF